jgi:hypothetical protein
MHAQLRKKGSFREELHLLVFVVTRLFNNHTKEELSNEKKREHSSQYDLRELEAAVGQLQRSSKFFTTVTTRQKFSLHTSIFTNNKTREKK